MADTIHLFGPDSILIKNAEVWVKCQGASQYLPCGAVKRGAGSVTITGITHEFIEAFIEGQSNPIKRRKSGESTAGVRMDLSEVTAFTHMITQGMDPFEDITITHATKRLTTPVGGRQDLPQNVLQLRIMDDDGTNVANITFWIAETVTGSDTGLSTQEESGFSWEVTCQPDHESHSGHVYQWEWILSTDDYVDTGVIDGGTNLSIRDAALWTDNTTNLYWLLEVTNGNANGDWSIICNGSNDNTRGLAKALTHTPGVGDTFCVYRPVLKIETA